MLGRVRSGVSSRGIDVGAPWPDRQPPASSACTLVRLHFGRLGYLGEPLLLETQFSDAAPVIFELDDRDGKYLRKGSAVGREGIVPGLDLYRKQGLPLPRRLRL